MTLTKYRHIDMMLTKLQTKKMSTTHMCPDCDGKLKGEPLGPWNSQNVDCGACGSAFFASAHGVERRKALPVIVEAGTKVRVWDDVKLVLRDHVMKHTQQLYHANRVLAKGMFFHGANGGRVYVKELDEKGFAVFKTDKKRWTYLVVKIG